MATRAKASGFGLGSVGSGEDNSEMWLMLGGAAILVAWWYYNNQSSYAGAQALTDNYDVGAAQGLPTATPTATQAQPTTMGSGSSTPSANVPYRVAQAASQISNTPIAQAAPNPSSLASSQVVTVADTSGNIYNLPASAPIAQIMSDLANPNSFNDKIAQANADLASGKGYQTPAYTATGPVYAPGIGPTAAVSPPVLATTQFQTAPMVLIPSIVLPQAAAQVKSTGNAKGLHGIGLVNTSRLLHTELLDVEVY